MKTVSFKWWKVFGVKQDDDLLSQNAAIIKKPLCFWGE